MNLKDEDEYTKAFNAVTEDAPEGDSDTEASAVTLGAEEAPEEAPVEMAESPADVPTQEAPSEEKPVDWEQKYKTLNKMIEREDDEAADAYLDKHGDIIGMHDYIRDTEPDLQNINAEIRRLGTTRSKLETPKERRKEIEELQRERQELLAPVKEFRREVLK